MTKKYFSLHHVNATPEDLVGNHGLGRYIILPGSDGRAKEISQQFDNFSVKHHPRGHNLYMGTINAGDKVIDVAAVATGMGCPSMEIVLHELFQLGGRRFLRVGTAGSMQPSFVKLGHLVNANSAVRDESTTSDYMPLEVPAMSSFEYTAAITVAAKKMGLTDKLHTGTVHCKSSLYAREFAAGPRGERNEAYMKLLADCGVLVTEMETAALFCQTRLYDYELMRTGKGPLHRVLCGAILGVIAVLPDQFVAASEEAVMMSDLIGLAFESIRTLAVMEAVVG